MGVSHLFPPHAPLTSSPTTDIGVPQMTPSPQTHTLLLFFLTPREGTKRVQVPWPAAQCFPREAHGHTPKKGGEIEGRAAPPKCWSPPSSCSTGCQQPHGTGSVPKGGVSSSPSGPTTLSLHSRQRTQFQEMSDPFPRPSQTWLGRDGIHAPTATRQLQLLHCSCTSAPDREAEIKPRNLKSKLETPPQTSFT